MIKTVRKKWGKEEWIVNEKEYCGKFLSFNRYAESSIHYHKKKKETFLVTTGIFKISWYPLKEYKKRLSLVCTKVLNKGDSLTLFPNIVHKIVGVCRNNVLLEISTYHDDKDVYRFRNAKLT